jgi:hypothetical protein
MPGSGGETKGKVGVGFADKHGGGADGFRGASPPRDGRGARRHMSMGHMGGCYACIQWGQTVQL